MRIAADVLCNGGEAIDGVGGCLRVSQGEPSYMYTPHLKRQRSTPAFSRGRLSAQNPHTVLSRICMKSDIKTVH